MRPAPIKRTAIEHFGNNEQARVLLPLESDCRGSGLLQSFIDIMFVKRRRDKTGEDTRQRRAKG